MCQQKQPPGAQELPNDLPSVPVRRRLASERRKWKGRANSWFHIVTNFNDLEWWWCEPILFYWLPLCVTEPETGGTRIDGIVLMFSERRCPAATNGEGFRAFVHLRQLAVVKEKKDGGRSNKTGSI